MSEERFNRFLSRFDAEGVSLLSVVVITSLMLLKLGVGFLTQSLSLVSGAFDSMLDLVAMFVISLTIRVATRPADYEYHYGRGKVENFSAFILSLLPIATSAWIFYEAARRYLSGKIDVEVNVWAFIVLGISIAVSFALSRLLSVAARRYNSQVFEAGALNFFTDLLSSGIVVVGLALTYLSQLWGVEVLGFGDLVAAVLVAGLVVRESLKISKSAMDVLLDRAPRGVAEKLRAVILSVDGVVECRRVRVRRSGSRFFVDTTILLDPSLPLVRASRVASEVERKILDVLPGADVVIDTDPHMPPRSVVERIRGLAMEEGLNIHGLTVRSVNGRLRVDVHLEVPSDISVEEASRLANMFEEKVRKDVSSVEEVNVQLEVLEDEVIKSSEKMISGEVIKKVKEAVESFWMKFPKYHVEVKNYDGESNVYITIYVDGAMSLERACEVSSELEDHVARQVPSVKDIIIEVEPYVFQKEGGEHSLKEEKREDEAKQLNRPGGAL